MGREGDEKEEILMGNDYQNCGKFQSLENSEIPQGTIQTTRTRVECSL